MDVRFKICGITREEDALCAVNAGAWAIGFIFVPKSPRYIAPENACKIIDKLPKNIEKIGVFVNFSLEEVSGISETSGITKIQLHGEETPDFCRKIVEYTGKEVIKAIRIKGEKDLELIENYKDLVSYILLDTYSEKLHGGTGKIFDWKLAKKACSYKIPIILAGGLNPDNISIAYSEVKPYALDLSSGVEISPGVKDKNKINQIKEIFKT